MTDRIQMKNPVAELDGDEFARVLWGLIKEKLLLPYIDLKTEYYDLGIMNRDATDDKVTYQAAESIKRLGVGVKCATITANAARKAEYNLKDLFPSPNHTIRSILDGTVFRKPIMMPCVQPLVPAWKKPIVIGRHAYGDMYKAAELRVPGPGKVEMVYTPADGSGEQRFKVADMPGSGVIQGMHNLDASIISFARSYFLYALSEKLPLLFGTKDTVSKIYDSRFKEIFAEIYETEFKEKCAAAGVTYSYTLIDDAVARMIQSEGGFLWACRNYDGDLMSDFVGAACGSIGMMTSVLVSPSGGLEYEAAHGTIQNLYYLWQKGEKVSANPTALIFAWTSALVKRAEFDNTPELAAFAGKLEAAVLKTVAEGDMTADLARIASPAPARPLDSWEFIDAIAKRL